MRLFELFGYSFGITAEILMAVIFFTAYSSPSKKVLISIDTFGEANMEVFIVIGMLLVSITGIAQYMHRNKPQ